MQKVEMYKASTGELFDTEAEALRCEAKWEIGVEIGNALYLRDVSGEDIADWIISNFEWLKTKVEVQ